ncbi:MAG: flagellar type III secretion system pore protein FliP [Oscillospiraceae bacterium]|jgi:flagellar biosynthetic protein FliP|nr:flagellar type III secretion system pore protein FliP [Oscillospiraceae bacterium]
MRRRRLLRAVLACLCLLPCLLFLPCSASAASAPPDTAQEAAPDGSAADTAIEDAADLFPFSLLDGEADTQGVTTTVEIMLLLTVLTLVPSILIMVTAFTRIVIVLSFTRNAMGTQQMPPNQVMVGLALFLTFFVMYPVYTQIVDEAWTPYQAEEISLDEAMDRTMTPLRGFMFEQIELQGNQTDLRTFMSMARMDMPETREEIPSHVLIPAFVTSEIKTAFQIGFMIYVPFIVVDMIVASALMSMGMMMLPPVMISLPFKIMLFVLVDGWNLTISSLVRTFQP